jgi:hypothetical protein
MLTAAPQSITALTGARPLHDTGIPKELLPTPAMIIF